MKNSFWRLKLKKSKDYLLGTFILSLLLLGCSSGSSSSSQQSQADQITLEQYIGNLSYYKLSDSPTGDYQQHVLNINSATTLTAVMVGFYSDMNCSANSLQKKLNLSSVGSGVKIVAGNYTATDHSNYDLVKLYRGASGTGSAAEFRDVKSIQITYLFAEAPKLVRTCLSNTQRNGERFANYSGESLSLSHGLVSKESSDSSPCTATHCSTSQSYSSYFAPACPAGHVKCFDGSCATSVLSCPTFPASTLNNHVLCPNGSWSRSVAGCNLPVSCTTIESPIRCLSGACVADIASCPTPNACNPGYVLCSDGKCAANISSCGSNKQPSCSNGLVNCPSGGCAENFTLCSSGFNCSSGKELCADGSCQESCSTPAPKTKCPANLVECPPNDAGVSCAIDLAQCPQTRQCPSDKPVLCWDDSCTDAVTNCPFHSSDFKRFICPDGSWEINLNNCATPTTCPSDRAYKCFDGTCRKDSAQCKKMSVCPVATPVLCKEGNCVKSSADCKSPLVCPSDLPFICPNGSCVESIGACDNMSVPLCSNTKNALCSVNNKCVSSTDSCNFDSLIGQFSKVNSQRLF